MKKENNKKNIKVKQKKIKQKKTKKLPKKLPNNKSMKQKMNKKTTKKKIAKRKVKITKFGGSTSLFDNYVDNSKIRRIFLRTITKDNQAVFTIDPVILQNNGKNNEINNADKILDFYISLWKDFANYDNKDNKNGVFITEFDQLTPSIPFLDIYKYMKHHNFPKADKFGELIGVDINNYKMTDTNNTKYLEAFKLFIQSVYDKFHNYNVDELFNLTKNDENYFAFNDYYQYLHIYVFDYLSVITSKNSNIEKDDFPYDKLNEFFSKIENKLRNKNSTDDANNLEKITTIQSNITENNTANNTANNDYEQNNTANNTDYDNMPPIMNITTDNNSPTDNKPTEPSS
jgi:hypothetical protein